MENSTVKPGALNLVGQAIALVISGPRMLDLKDFHGES